MKIRLESISNPTTANGSNGNAIISGLTPTTNYTLYYYRNKILSSSSITSDSNGKYQISSLRFGYYNGVCFNNGSINSNKLSFILSDIGAPTTGFSINQPPSCGGYGSVTIYTNLGNTFCTLDYDIINTAGTTHYTVTINTNTILSNLQQCVISNLMIVRNSDGLRSPVIPNIVIKSPTSPTICVKDVYHLSSYGGSNGKFELAGFLASTNYTVYYTYNYNSTQISVTQNSDINGVLAITGLNDGIYTDIYAIASVGGCQTSSIRMISISYDLQKLNNLAVISNTTTGKLKSIAIQKMGVIGKLLNIAIHKDNSVRLLNIAIGKTNYLKIKSIAVTKSDHFFKFRNLSIQKSTVGLIHLYDSLTNEDITNAIITITGNYLDDSGNSVSFSSIVTTNINGYYSADLPKISVSGLLVTIIASGFRTYITTLNPQIPTYGHFLNIPMIESMPELKVSEGKILKLSSDLIEDVYIGENGNILHQMSIRRNNSTFEK